MDFLLARDDLHRCRFVDGGPVELEDGQARLRVDAFGLTANNITYAVFGDAMSYWSFFPAEDGWGRVPVWGFAEVSDSRAAALEAGTRVFGYLPPSSELCVQPANVDERGFVDAAPHRAHLPPAYNGYARVDADPVYDAGHEDAQMLLRPLFFTAYLIDDFLDEADTFRAATVVLSSASSKTASALAYLLSQRGDLDVIGLTSARSADFVRGLGVYDHVLGYEELDALPAGRAVYVDISGDADVRAAVHERYRDDLSHSAVVGATHHDRMDAVPDGLPGPRPTFFFAPDRVAKRSADWGREQFQSRLAEAWQGYVPWTEEWLEIVHGGGPEALERTYLDLLDGRIEPSRADVLTLSA
jgi:hypothetical protein